MSWPAWVDVDARLGPGKTCGDCVHLRRCLMLGFTDSAANTWCDFIPVRFLARKDAESA